MEDWSINAREMCVPTRVWAKLLLKCRLRCVPKTKSLASVDRLIAISEVEKGIRAVTLLW